MISDKLYNSNSKHMKFYRTVLIYEPSAIGGRTHNLKALVNWSKIIQAAGLNVEWLCNSKLVFENDISYKVFKDLDYTIYDDIHLKRFNKRDRCFDFIKHKILVVKTALVLATYLKQGRHIFFPTFDWIALEALYLLSRICKFNSVLHFNVMYEHGNWMTGGYSFPKVVNALKKLSVSANIHLYTETTAMAEKLKSVTSLEVGCCAFPVINFNVSEASNKDFTVGCLGGGRRDKGFDLLPAIVEYVLQKDPTIKFNIQMPREEDGLGKEVGLLKKASNVHLLPNTLTEEQYLNYFSASSILVFPYSDVYRARGSGVVYESVASKKPFICSEDTGLIDALYSSNGYSVERTPEQFAYHIIKAKQAQAALKENAIKAADIYRERLYKCDLIKNIQLH